MFCDKPLKLENFCDFEILKCLDIVLNYSGCCCDGLSPKLVWCWVEIRLRLRPGYPKNKENSTGFPAQSLGICDDLIIVRVCLRTQSSPKLIKLHNHQTGLTVKDK